MLNSNVCYVDEKPNVKALFKAQPEDFIVIENLDVSFAGEGEHYYLYIKKIGENTSFIANELARFLKLKPLHVSYSGMKDRHAVTSQWFSVQIPGKPLNLDWSEFTAFSNANAHLLATEHHNKKLRRGAHASNDFIITLRGIAKTTELEDRLHRILKEGAPNYFGFQRFGRDDDNLIKANEWLLGNLREKRKHIKSLYLSAMRSFLFNRVLSERVKLKSWQNIIAGEPDSDIPTGPLWGRGNTGCENEALDFEQSVLEPYKKLCDKMEFMGLNQERRPLVLKPLQFDWHWGEDTLVINMRLKSGQFATTVLREIVQLDQLTS